MDLSTIQRLNDLGDQLSLLTKPLKLTQHNTPLNRVEEKEKFIETFLNGSLYNPQFRYSVPPDKWGEPLFDFLADLKPEHSRWEKLLYEDVESTLASIKSIQTHDPELITLKTIKSYGNVNSELINQAYEEINALILNSSIEERIISAEEIASHMQEALSKAGLHEWLVIIDKTMTARMSVRGSDKQVKIREGEFFTKNEIKRLLVHEIGTHVFRSVNGNSQNLRILRFGLDNYLLTEEGLATYHENLYGVRNLEDQKRYALRVIAAYHSLTKGFYDVFSEIASYTTNDEAFEIVVRAKRGFTDTSVPGAHVKDKVYFEGFQKVTHYLSQNPNDHSMLMTGKISIEMLPLVQELDQDGLLVKPTYLPDMLINQN